MQFVLHIRVPLAMRHSSRYCGICLRFLGFSGVNDPCSNGFLDESVLDSLCDSPQPRSAAAIGHAAILPDPGPEVFTSSCNVDFACCSLRFSTCNILVNTSHDRLAHNQGPCYRPTAAAHRTGRSSSANRPLSAGSVTYARQASPDLSSRTYVYIRLALRIYMV